MCDLNLNSCTMCYLLCIDISNKKAEKMIYVNFDNDNNNKNDNSDHGMNNKTTVY